MVWLYVFTHYAIGSLIPKIIYYTVTSTFPSGSSLSSHSWIGLYKYFALHRNKNNPDNTMQITATQVMPPQMIGASFFFTDAFILFLQKDWWTRHSAQSRRFHLLAPYRNNRLRRMNHGNYDITIIWSMLTRGRDIRWSWSVHHRARHSRDRYTLYRMPSWGNRCDIDGLRKQHIIVNGKPFSTGM